MSQPPVPGRLLGLSFPVSAVVEVEDKGPDLGWGTSGDGGTEIGAALS